MREENGNIFETEASAVCITTNGVVKANGENVMGRGNALEAANRIPGLAKRLGVCLKDGGNHVHQLGQLPSGATLLSFPTKPDTVIYNGKDNIVSYLRDKYAAGTALPGWMAVSDTELILQSARELVAMTDQQGWRTVVLPRPGCESGQLEWCEIKPQLGAILDDRFVVMVRS